jgi:hypothetical protein
VELYIRQAEPISVRPRAPRALQAPVLAVACTAVLAPVLQAPVLAVARTAVLAPVLPALVLAEVVRAGADPGCNVAMGLPAPVLAVARSARARAHLTSYAYKGE